MRLPTYLALSSLLLGPVSACGSDDEPEPFKALDPAQPHYGKTFDQWAADWVYYAMSYAPPLCDDPIKDATGANCAARQDPSSPVFFLVGTYGGPAVRKECVVPSDAAIFFPLVNIWGDNAGMPEDMFLSDADVKANIEATVPTIIEDSFYATVDGRPVPDLIKGFKKEAVPYLIHIPDAPNSYTCDGHGDSVHGDFPGYVAGAWVMLPPLGPGEHVITFGSARRADAPDPAFQIDVTYELTVMGSAR